MHELALADAILAIVSRHAAGRRVTKIDVRIGQLRQVVPTALTFSFEVLAQGTPVEGAVLEMESIPAVGRCRHCTAESRLHAFPLQCQACGGLDLEVIAGDELWVDSLEVEDEDGCSDGADSSRRGRARRQRQDSAGEPGDVRSGGSLRHQHDERSRGREDDGAGTHARSPAG